MSTSMLQQRMGNSRHHLFWNIGTDIACFLDKCWISVSLCRQLLEEYLPGIVHKVLDVETTHKHASSRTLRLKLNDRDARRASLRIDTSKELSKRTIHFAVGDVNYGSIQNLIKIITRLDSINELKLLLKKQMYYRRGSTNFDFYDEIIKGMPSLKDIAFAIPTMFVETDTRLTCKSYKVHPLVQSLTLQATANTTANMQEMFERCFVAFPNLTRLNLHYYSGGWKEGGGEFQIEIPKYSLQTLDIDATLLQTKMKNHFKKEELKRSDFFVVEVSPLRNSERFCLKCQYRILQQRKVSTIRT